MNFDFSLDPFEQFQKQLSIAEAQGIPEPNAMSLATSSKEGEPSVRTVLFKGLVRKGFSFYTNYNSPKSENLISNPKASILFFWPVMAQQIRIIGSVDQLTREESEAYFNTRPRLSQLGAWASDQSQKISNLDDLAKKVEELDKKYANQPVPCPSNWGGFRLVPREFEFWFGKQGRLHERYIYQNDSNQKDGWNRFMRSP